MKRAYILFLLSLMLLSAQFAAANNIHVSNFSLTGQNTTDKFVMVQFDLSWENSWRTSSAPST